MNSFSFRPSFSHRLDVTPESAVKTLAEKLGEDPIPYEVKCFPDFICVRIPESERHFWTPRLMLGLEDGGGTGTMVHGTYGPNANVWGLFFYGYLLIGLGALFSGIFCFFQWRTDMPPWGLWIFWTMAFLAAVMYATGQMGKRLGAEQTLALHRAFERAVGQTIVIQ